MSIEPSYILVAVTIVQAIQIIGRWTGRIDTSGEQFRDDLKKIKDTQYRFIQWEQVVSGKLGILENDIKWVREICDRRHIEK